MTAFSFILGVIPLLIATRAGFEMRRTLGTAVFSGMLGVILFGLFLKPVFYVVLRGLARRRDTQRTTAGTSAIVTKEPEMKGEPMEREGPSADYSTSPVDFERIYADRPPWDVGKPQPAFVDIADESHGSVLDVGCGTGELAMYFAERGNKVVGVDFLEPPLTIARQKAAERGLDIEFIQHDALRLDQLDRQFDNVLDSGLLHGLSDEDRIQYAAVIKKVLIPKGKLYLQCFSDQEPDGDGPRRIGEAELREVFKSGWQLHSISPTRFVVRDDTDLTFSDGGPKAWFCIVGREQR